MKINCTVECECSINTEKKILTGNIFNNQTLTVTDKGF